MPTPPLNRWAALGDGPDGAAYSARFERLAARGVEVHGEADLCTRLAPSGGRVLDAGCGTGRVAIRLAALGFDCVGVDSDYSMLAVARSASSAVPGSVHWELADLAALDRVSATDGPFDLVVAAGNVIPLLAAGTEANVIAALGRRLGHEGLLVTGFGLDAAHLPLAAPPFGLTEFDAWSTAAGLSLVDRFATWAGEAYEGGGYVVNVQSRRS